MAHHQVWCYPGMRTSSHVSTPVLGQLQFNVGASSPTKRWKAPRKYLKASIHSRLSRSEIHHRDMGFDSDDRQLSLSRQMQQGLPLAGSSAQAAASSVNGPSVNRPRVDTSSSKKPRIQPGSNTIPSSGPPTSVATPALPFGTPQSVFGGQPFTKTDAFNTSSPPGGTPPFPSAFGNSNTALSAPSSGFGGPPSMDNNPLSTSSAPGGTSIFHNQIASRNPQPVFGAPRFSFGTPQSVNTQPLLTTSRPAATSAFQSAIGNSQPDARTPQSVFGGSPSLNNSFLVPAPAGTLAVQSAVVKTQPQAGFGATPPAFGGQNNDSFSKVPAPVSRQNNNPFLQIFGHSAPAGASVGQPASQSAFGNPAFQSALSSLQTLLKSAAPASSPPSGALQWTPSDDTSQFAAQVGFRPPRPSLTFFFHNGQDWEMLTGQGHLEYTAAYWKCKDGTLFPKSEVECVISNVEYVLNWYEMVQTRKSTGTKRSIKWQDLSTGVFTLPPGELHPRVPALSPIPNCHLLDVNDPLFGLAKAGFERNYLGRFIMNARIIGIRKVSVNAEKELQFKVAVDWLKQKRGDANVAHCWHGSSLSSIEKIVEHGFGTFTNPLNGRYYGDGIYLGANAYISHKYARPGTDGVRHMLFCEAALGKLEKSDSTMTQPSSAAYDSGTNDTLSPSLYVVYSMNLPRVLPKAIVSYIEK